MNKLYKSLINKVADTGDGDNEDAAVSNDNNDVLFYKFDLDQILKKLKEHGIESDDQGYIIYDQVMSPIDSNNFYNTKVYNRSSGFTKSDLDLATEYVIEYSQDVARQIGDDYASDEYISPRLVKIIEEHATNTIDQVSKDDQVSEDDKGKAIQALSYFKDRTSLYENALSELLDQAYNNNLYTYLTINYRFSDDQIEKKRSEGNENFDAFTEEEIDSNSEEPYGYLLSKYILEKIYSVEDVPAITFEYDESDLEPEAEEYLKEEYFDAARFSGRKSKKIYESAYKKYSEILLNYLNNYEYSLFYNSQYSNMELTNEVENPAYNIVRFKELNSEDDNLNAFANGEFATKLVINFPEINKCHLKYAYEPTNVALIIECDLESKSLQIISGSEGQGKTFLSFPNWKPTLYNTDPLFSFIEEKRNYLAFKYLAENSYNNEMLFTGISRSKLNYREGLSGSGPDTSSGQLDILLKKIYDVYDPDESKDPGIDDAINRANPLRALRGLTNREDQNSEELEGYDSYYSSSMAGLTPGQIKSTEVMSKKEKETILNPDYSLTGIANRENLLIEPKPVGGISEEDLVAIAQRNQAFLRMYEQDISKIYDLKAKIPRKFSKIIENAITNINDPDKGYGRSRSNTKDSSYEAEFLNFGDPAQNQVVATYIENFVSNSWSTLSPTIKDSFSEIGIEMSDTEMAQILESYQTESINALKDTGTSRSISSIGDILSIVNFDFTEQSITNDFESFMVKYKSEVANYEKPKEETNEADDFEIKKSFLKDLSLKNSLNFPIGIRRHLVDSLYKFASGDDTKTMTPEIDIVSDPNSGELRSKVYSDIHFYEEMRKGQYFLPISIKGEANISLESVRFLHDSNNRNGSGYTGAKGRFPGSSYNKTLPFSTIFYAQKDSITMANDLLEFRDSGKNLMETEGVLQALGVSEEELEGKISSFVQEKSASGVTEVRQVELDLKIECLGGEETFKLSLKKINGKWTTLISGLEKPFAKVLPKIEETILDLYTSETNGMMHRYLPEGDVYPVRSRDGVSTISFNEWSSSGPRDSVVPIEVHFDSEGNAKYLSSGNPVNISIEENHFAARYSKADESIIPIHGRMPDPRTPAFFGRPNLGEIRQINLNGSGAVRPASKTVPSIFDIDTNSAADRAIINTFDPINRIAINNSTSINSVNGLSTKIVQEFDKKYLFVKQPEIETNKKISALLDVLECLKYIGENQILSDIPLEGEIEDLRKKVYFESVRDMSGVIIDSILKERQALLTVPDGAKSVSLDLGKKKSLIALDSCLLEIKKICDSGNNRLFSHLSRTLSNSASWLKPGSNLVFSSDGTIPPNRSNFSSESMKAAKDTVSSETISLAQRCSSNIYSSSQSLIDSGTTYSKNIPELSRVFYLFMTSDELNIESLDFDQKINFMTSILSNAYAGKPGLAPDSYKVYNPHELLHEILTENDDFLKVLSEDEIARVKTISEINKAKRVMGSRVTINTEEELTRFLSSDDGKQLKQFLDNSKSKFNQGLIDLAEAIESKNVDDYNGAISKLNKEIFKINSFKDPGGFYIKQNLIDNIILGNIKEFETVSGDIPEFIKTVSKLKPYGRGFALSFLSDISNEDSFYRYIISDQNIVTDLKVTLLQELQMSSKITINSIAGSDLEFSLDTGDKTGTNRVALIDDIIQSENFDANSIQMNSLEELYLDQEAERLSRGSKIDRAKKYVDKNILDPINFISTGDKDAIIRAYYCLDKDEFAKIVIGSWPNVSGPINRTYQVQTSFDTNFKISEIKIIASAQGFGDKEFDALKSSKSVEQALTKRIFSSEAINNFSNPRDAEEFKKIILKEIKQNPNMSTKINFLGYDSNGKSRYSISIYHNNKAVLTTGPMTIDQITKDSAEHKIFKEALVNAGYVEDTLNDTKEVKIALSEINRDADAISRLRTADLTRGVRTFEIIYSEKTSKNLLEAIEEINKLSISQKASIYNKEIKSYIDEKTRKMTTRVSDGALKEDINKIYGQLSASREYYNSNRYSNPDLANKILDDIKAKFTDDSPEDIKKFLYYMGFDTMTRPIESGASGVARASMTIQELKALESHLKLIEDIRLRNSYFSSDYKSFEQRIVDEIIPSPKNYIRLDGTTAELGVGDNNFERARSLVDFLLEEIEYIEGTGNFELASRMRSGLYGALDVSGSRYLLRTSDDIFTMTMQARWVTRRTNDLGWFLSKLGYFSESDLKKASDILSEAKDLGNLLQKKSQELSTASSKLKAELEKGATKSLDEIESITSEIEKLEEEIERLERAIESSTISEVELDSAKERLIAANMEKEGLSKTRKVLKFGSNMLIGSANPLNSMEFLYLSMAYSVGSGLAGKLVETGVSLISSFPTISSGISNFLGSIKNNFSQFLATYVSGATKASRLKEIIPTYRAGAGKESGEGTNKLIQIVENSTYNSYANGSINNNDLRRTQEAIASNHAKPKGKIPSGGKRSAWNTIKAVFGVLGKIVAKLFMVIYAKTLYDNMTGDQAETGVLFPAEIAHNLSMAFMEMKDYTFKSSNCTQDNCDKNLFSDQDTIELSVGNATKRSLYYAILDSESYTELNSGIEKLILSKVKIKEIIQRAQTAENINNNLDDSAKLAGVYASHVEIFTTISTVLPRVLSDSITMHPVGNWIIHAVLKTLGLFLATLNAVDIISLFANKVLAYGDKFKPTEIAMEGSLKYIDKVIDDIINTLKSLNVFQVTYKNHIASEMGANKDIYLYDFYQFYNEKLRENKQ